MTRKNDSAKGHVRILSRLLFALVLLIVLGAQCNGTGTPPEVLPGEEERPDTDLLEFTGASEGAPPQVSDISNVSMITSEEIPGALTDELEDQILDLLRNDDQVRQALGERFAFIRLDQVFEEKTETFPQNFLATYYSYSNNQTVRVPVRGEDLQRGEIERIESTEFQPHEGVEEIQVALSLARAALIERDFILEGPEGSALLAFPRDPAGGGFFENRVLYVVFTQGMEPELFVLVDLTNREVLEAGPVAGSSQAQ